MRTRVFFPFAGACAIALVASVALADEPSAPDASRSDAQVVAFSDAGARFHVDHDATAGTMTFRLADDSRVQITDAPVVTLQTDDGPRDVTLVAVDGQPGAWRLSDDALRSGRARGSMKIVVDGKTHTTSLPVASAAATDVPAPVAVPTEERVPPATPASLEEPAVPAVAHPAAKFGGRVVALADCGGAVEVVEDASAGTLKIYSHLGSDVTLDGDPTLVLVEAGSPRTIAMTKLEGEALGWSATGLSLQPTTLQNARLRLTIAGKVCEAPLVATHTDMASMQGPAPAPMPAPAATAPRPATGGGCPFSGGAVSAPAAPHRAPAPAAPAAAATKSRGGQVVVFDGGPRFEVVRDPSGGSWTFYQLDDTVAGRPVVFEQPPVVIADNRTYTLTRVENDPRAWRLAGLDAGVTPPGDARMRMTLFGRSLETNVGLSGVGVGVR